MAPATWAGTAVLLGMLVMVRDAYGALSLVLTGAVVVAISLWAPADVRLRSATR